MEKITDTFDFIFIDADKKNNANYVKLCLKLLNKNGTIVVDNVVRNGNLVDKNINDPNTEGNRNLFEYLKHNESVDATAIQTVGSKGYDGMVIIKYKD